MSPIDRTEERVRLGLEELFPEPTAVDLLPEVTAHMRRHRRWQRSGLFAAGLAAAAAVAAAIALVVGSAAGKGPSGHQEASCAAVLVWHGHTYLGDELSSAKHPGQVGLVPARRMSSLGQFPQPACGDTGRSGAGSTAAVERISGVSPQAIVAGSDGTPYLRLRSHSAVAVPTKRAEAAARRLALQRWIIWISP